MCSWYITYCISSVMMCLWINFYDMFAKVVLMFLYGNKLTELKIELICENTSLFLKCHTSIWLLSLAIRFYVHVHRQSDHYVRVYIESPLLMLISNLVDFRKSRVKSWAHIFFNIPILASNLNSPASYKTSIVSISRKKYSRSRFIESASYIIYPNNHVSRIRNSNVPIINDAIV